MNKQMSGRLAVVLTGNAPLIRLFAGQREDVDHAGVWFPSRRVLDGSQPGAQPGSQAGIRRPHIDRRDDVFARGM
jgi:hypothetical protein